jgi:hypothetical protein
MSRIVMHVNFTDGPCKGQYQYASEILATENARPMVSRWSDGLQHFYSVAYDGTATYLRTKTKGSRGANNG